MKYGLSRQIKQKHEIAKQSNSRQPIASQSCYLITKEYWLRWEETPFCLKPYALQVQSGALLQPKKQIHILHSLSRSTFEQVVGNTDD